ncbi:podocalyxin-like protein 2 [Hippocampus comes]|uniref:podocalyxin-like protein 2 n=1 Tax=Hippocampus comes TaxID=109280 RepID=UPI00094F089E|nr:PREDICTED: podocalyxin-like protein 2 [Hippocampus comes]
MMRWTAADLAALRLFIFVTLIALPLSESFVPKPWNLEDPKRVLLGGDAEASLEEASGLFRRLEKHHVVKRMHGTLDLDTMIGYAPPSAPPDLPEETGPHQALEAELDEGGHFSGFGILDSSVSASTTTTTTMTTGVASSNIATTFGILDSSASASTTTTTGVASSNIATTTVAPGTSTGTGTDFGLLAAKDFTRNATVARIDMATSIPPRQPKEEEEKEKEGKETGATSTSDVSPNGGLSETSWNWMTTAPQEAHVVCVDWTQPSGHGYVILNMTHNLNCEEFRSDGGMHLLKTMERRFARRLKSPEGSWVIYLSKPTHQQRQMLMHVASEHGVMSTKELLNLLGEMRLSLNKVGIQDYSAPSTCPPRRSPSQRSDYSKLFVVLVVIGSICLAIITSGFIYICWKRRPPTAKTTFRGEELRFVENGCHDNPTLDVAGDNHPDDRPQDRQEDDEDQKKKNKRPSTNGLVGGGEGVCRDDDDDDNPHWQVFVNQAVAEEEEEEEEDTHL